MVYYHSSGESGNRLHILWMPMPIEDYKWPGNTRCIVWFDKPIVFQTCDLKSVEFASGIITCRKS